MDVTFPYPVRVKSSVPKLSGLRYTPFTNVDNESFGKPALNGFWNLDMAVFSTDMQSELALSVFVTQMEAAGSTCVVPITTRWRPNNAKGRMLKPSTNAPEYTFDHVGFSGDPFDGFTLRSAASHRDSYIDVNKPSFSLLWPGHYVSLGENLHQVTKVSAIGESETAIRVSLMPNVRGDHALGDLVIVDDLRLKCRMRSGDQIGQSIEVVKSANLSFVEAF